MRTFTNLLKFGFLPLLCFALAVGCTESPDEPQVDGPNITKDSVIKMEKSTITASLAGGT